MECKTDCRNYNTGEELLEAIRKLPEGTQFEALSDWPVKGNYKLIILENKTDCRGRV